MSAKTYQVSVSAHPRAATDFEIVERKGVGHPDTLADAIAESTSRRYSAWFHEHFGAYAHHWFDKVILIGGESRIDYGVGELVSPYHVILIGKAVRTIEGQHVPLECIFKEAATDVLTQHLHAFDPDRHLVCEVRVRDSRGPGQKGGRYRPETRSDLVTALGVGVSNDCNLCAGFSPLSITEQMVAETEAYLCAPEYRTRNHTGTDVKLVGTRRQDAFELLVNLPFLAEYVTSWEDYLHRVGSCTHDIAAFIMQRFHKGVRLTVNPEKEAGRPYLTVTGSVADTGDVGVVGRGNRINGLITPMRPMSIEASSGKNPLDHTGKLYGLIARRLSSAIHTRLNAPNEVYLVSAKEKALDAALDVHVVLTAAADERHASNASLNQDIESLVGVHIGQLPDLVQELMTTEVVQW